MLIKFVENLKRLFSCYIKRTEYQEGGYHGTAYPDDFFPLVPLCAWSSDFFP